MLDRNELNAAIVKRGKTGKEVAEAIGITPKTFYSKMKKGVFGSDEIEVMVKYLSIDDPMKIFLQIK